MSVGMMLKKVGRVTGYVMCVSNTNYPPDARHGPGSSLCFVIVLAVTSSTLC